MGILGMSKIKKGDEVIVITGKDKGKRGKVLRVTCSKNGKIAKLFIEGVNLVKKHVKPNPNTNTEGGIVEREAAIDASNVAIFNYVTNKADKIGYKFLSEEKRKVRYFKSNGELIDI